MSLRQLVLNAGGLVYAASYDVIDTTWTSGSPLILSSDFSAVDSGGYAFIDRDDTLKCWWRFDQDGSKGETSTRVYDWSGNGHWLGISSATIDSGGRCGNCLNIANTGVARSEFNTGWLNFYDGEDITISAWVNFSAATSNHGYFVELSGPSNISLYRHIGGTLSMMYRWPWQTANSYLGAVGTIPKDDAWHMATVVITRATNSVSFYIDGALSSTGTFAASPPLNVAFTDVSIGGAYFKVNGKVDEVLIFSRSLSADEIAQLYSFTPGNATAQLPAIELASVSYTGHCITADGNKNTDGPHSVLVDTSGSAPSVTLASPCDSSRVSGTSASLTVSASVTSMARTLSTATLWFGTEGSLSETETVALSGTSASHTFTVSSLSDGTYAWNVVVTDSGSASGEAASDAVFEVGQTSYYVATTGSDSAAGTIGAPFLTLQKFANICKPGDTCFVRAGTYRESVTVSTSGTEAQPITIKAYPGETVVINGCDLLTGWTNVSGEIYKASFAGHLGRGLNQVFVDGNHVLEARWPKATSLLEDTKSSAAIDAGSSYNTTTLTLVDADLNEADDFWNGATVHTVWNTRYHSITALVTDFVQATHTLSATLDTASSGAGTMTSYGQYCLIGALGSLTQENEWVMDFGTDELRLWVLGGGSPASHTVEVKQRQVGITVNASWVNLEQLQVKACNVILGQSASHCTIDGLTASYLSHYTVLNASTMGTGKQGLTDTGVVLNGHHNTLTNSSVLWSAGNGVSLLGHDNVVENSEIGYCNYMLTECACVSTGYIGAYDNLITRNNIHHSARAVVEFGYSTRVDITHNDISYGCYDGWAWDGGLMYSIQTDGDGAEIAYNHLQEAGGNYGLYFDILNWNFVVHHNLIEDTGIYGQIGMLMNERGGGFTVHHNTVESEIYFDTLDGYATSGNSIQNNIADRIRVRINGAGDVAMPGSIGVESNNIEYELLTAGQQAALFTDKAGNDFTLGASSVAIDAGINLGYALDLAGNPRNVGSAPDAGAYERQS